jgi:hypothetical protein
LTICLSVAAVAVVVPLVATDPVAVAVAVVSLMVRWCCNQRRLRLLSVLEELLD